MPSSSQHFCPGKTGKTAWSGVYIYVIQVFYTEISVQQEAYVT